MLHRAWSACADARLPSEPTGIIASALTEPIMREPKFWLVKVQAIPLATVRPGPDDRSTRSQSEPTKLTVPARPPRNFRLQIVLFAQLCWKRPSIEAPAQINHTLILLLALILVVLAPVLTSIPVDSDHGRLSLARKILEHIIGPAALMGGLVAVHRVVFEQLYVRSALALERLQPADESCRWSPCREHEVSQPPSTAYTDDEDYLEDDEPEEGYVYDDDSEDERLATGGQEEDEGLVAEDHSGSLAPPPERADDRETGLANGEERADHLKAHETR
jgi:hypothetical protein